jgi:hypothetical protein
MEASKLKKNEVSISLAEAWVFYRDDLQKWITEPDLAYSQNHDKCYVFL